LWKLAVASLCLFVFVSIALTGVSTAQEGSRERPIDIDNNRVEIYLQSQDTTVGHDEDLIFTLSATNYITNKENLSVQLILQSSSGSEVFSVAGVERSSGSQFNTVTTVEPGGQESIRIHLNLNEPGEHNIRGQAIYFFGENRSRGNGVEVTIPVKQNPPPPSTIESVSRVGINIIPATYNWIKDGIIGVYNSLSLPGLRIMYIYYILGALFVTVLCSSVLYIFFGKLDYKTHQGRLFGLYIVNFINMLIVVLLFFRYLYVGFNPGQISPERSLFPSYLSGIITFTLIVIILSPIAATIKFIIKNIRGNKNDEG
jgi:hypothetical protein